MDTGMTSSERVRITLGREAVRPAVLSAAGSFSGTGLLEVKRRILTGEPVIEVELFTNDWFDGGADRLLALLTHWQVEGTPFEIWEVTQRDDDAAVVLISLELLATMVSSGNGPAPECWDAQRWRSSPRSVMSPGRRRRRLC